MDEEKLSPFLEIYAEMTEITPEEHVSTLTPTLVNLDGDENGESQVMMAAKNTKINNIMEQPMLPRETECPVMIKDEDTISLAPS